MNSIGWGGHNRGNVAAIRTIPTTLNPAEYNKNQLKGLKGPSEPVPTYGSSRLPITKDADQWGFRTATSTRAGEKNPSFNSTYLEADPKYAGLKEVAPVPGGREHSIKVFQEHTSQPTTMGDIGNLIKGLPIAQAKQLEEAAKEKKTKEKWAAIVANLIKLEKARAENAGTLTPEQTQIAEKITEAVESGIANLKVGKSIDPDDLGLTYIEPDPIGADKKHDDTEASPFDDQLTIDRKNAKKQIVKAFPNNEKLREMAMEAFGNRMKEKAFKTKKYKKLSQEEQMKVQREVLDEVIATLKRRNENIGDKIDAEFKQADDDYMDAYNERKKDEDKANEAAKKLIKDTSTITLKDFKAQNKDGQHSKNLYISKPKLEVIADYYGVKKGSNRSGILSGLYKIPDFVERATRGYFPKNAGVDAMQEALERPLNKKDFVPVNTPMTLPVKPKKGKGMPVMKGSGRHASWRDKFLI